MSEEDKTSTLGGDEDVFEPEQESNLGDDDEANVEIHEPKEEVLRRKKIRRQLERRLEQKRLREELDDFIDLDEEIDDDVLDDEANKDK